MEIKEMNNYGGQNIFADKIENSTFISSESDSKLLEIIEMHGKNTEEKETLKENLKVIQNPTSTKEEKTKSKAILEKFLYDPSLAISTSIVGSILYDIGKRAFSIG